MVQSNEFGPVTRRGVVVGCGGTGASVAVALADRGFIVHVLDLKAEALDRLPRGMLANDQLVPTVGDGTLERDLIAASIRDADVFAALSGGDAINALSAQLARQVFEVSLVLCRIDDPDKQQMYRDLGLVTMSATGLIRDGFMQAVNG